MEAAEQETLVAVPTVDSEKQGIYVAESILAGEDSTNCIESNGVSENADAQNPQVDVQSVNSETIKSEFEKVTVHSTEVPESHSPEVPHGNDQATIVSNDQATIISNDHVVTTVNIDVTHLETEVEISNIDNENEIAEADQYPIDCNNLTNADDMSLDCLKNNENEKMPVEIKVFKTEVVVVKEELPISFTEKNSDGDVANNILSQLEGQSIDLGDVLRSSGTSEGSDNNNSFIKQQEVLNKEELLDILEGNDTQEIKNHNNKDIKNNDQGQIVVPGTSIAKLALEQLTKLKKGKRMKGKLKNQFLTEKRTKKADSSTESIAKVLEKDWEDDDVDEKSQEALNATDTAEPNKTDHQFVNKQEPVDRSSLDSALSQLSEDRHSQSPVFNKSSDEAQPQRRAGRVIKRKVIYDPDNPDTFTNTKSSGKLKDSQIDKEQPIKKGKTEPNALRSKSKSPIIKTQWKKPQPKNSKHKRKLTEVDKLLMDEGAVNMIYQLTPEASKGKKNMRKKAELIKKINQSSTPDNKEMKFRERRKDSKTEEHEVKKIITGKQRTSLCSSVKSPAICEDFEAHTADDSIIYRRHSSSSYSSTCMSPRRLSDVDSGVQISNKISQQAVDSQDTQSMSENDNGDELSNKFMSDTTDPSGHQVIDKKDCLSIKEKLNSKLSRALNIKRKRDSTKTEKPLKQKKSLPKPSSEKISDKPEFLQLSLTFSDSIAEICVQETGSDNNLYNIGTFIELTEALELIDKKKEVSVTLLTSQSGNICSGLDMKPLLNENVKLRTKYAYDFAECIRSFLHTLERHSKLLATGAAGACEGLALAVLVLCDVTVASDRATFALSSGRSAPIVPGVAVLTVHSEVLPKSLVDEMLVFGRQLSATEALQRGLVSRTLWPDRFKDELHAIVKDIAAQPVHTLLFKKRLLTLKRNVTGSSFLSCLDAERDLLVQYWTSDEGQTVLKAYLGCS